MKVIIIGLGNFGSALGIRLTASGHEVLGVDNNMQKVENYKDKITHTVCMDCTDPNALGSLPLKDTDLVIVAIGEDITSSLMATATLKQLNVKKLISRHISNIQRTVVEAIGVDEIISPEEDSAERLVKRLEIEGVVDSYSVSEDYSIVEAEVPERYVGKTVEEAKFREKYKVNIVTIIRPDNGRDNKRNVLGVVVPSTLMKAKDILVLFGHITDIERLLEKKI